MMLGYPAVRRYSDLPHSPQSPGFTANSPFSPEAGPSSPRTPTHQISLSRVDENSSHHERQTTGGSRAPLVSRDYAFGGKKSRYTTNKAVSEDEEPRNDTGSFVILTDDKSSELETPHILSPPPSRKPPPPKLIPPESVHDVYLSSYFNPINPAPTEPNSPARPEPLVRASSAPGKQTLDSANLLPSPLNQSPDPLAKPPQNGAASKLKGSELEGKPIFEIFDAELTDDGEGLARALKGHLEGVLKVQEEVGRMHLALEGMGLEDGLIGEVREGEEADPMRRREQGVDEIMKRLDGLSDKLRTYHHLGTPKLSFPQSSQPNTAKQRSQSIDPASLPNINTNMKPINISPARTPIMPDHHLHASPTMISPTQGSRSIFQDQQDHQKQTSISSGFGDYLPGVHEGMRYRPRESTTIRETDEIALNKRSSVPASINQYNNSMGGGSRRGSLAAVLEDKSNERKHLWFDRVNGNLNMSRAGLDAAESGVGYGSDGGNSRKIRGYTQSPIEMVDRSRPW